MQSTKELAKDKRIRPYIAALSLTQIPFYCSEDFNEMDVLGEIDGQLYAANLGPYGLECGASKVVIIPHNLPFVFKIPICGVGNQRYKGANYAIPAVPADDYCAREAYLYTKAEEQHLSSMFAGTRLLAHTPSNPIYISEKCTPILDEERPLTDTPALKDSIIKQWDEISLYHLLLLAEDWGAGRLAALHSFIKQYHIQDIKGGKDYNNLMINSITKKIVLADYSSFFSCDYIK